MLFSPSKLPSAPPTMASSVVQNSISWTLDSSYQVGRFLGGSGSPWVVAPSGLTVVSVSTPPIVDSGDPASDRHGSTVNPPQGASAYDGRMPGYNQAHAKTFPLFLSPGDSLTTTISHTATGTRVDMTGHNVSENHAHIEEGEVLTVLASAPSPTAFCPPTHGTDKPLYDAANILYGLLPDVADPGGVPTLGSQVAANYCSDYTRYFERPWINMQMEDWTARQGHALQNTPNYHREVYRLISDACAIIMTDRPGREDLVMHMVQVGIEMGHAGLQAAAISSSTEADSSLARILPLMAEVLLGVTAFNLHPYTLFRTTFQTHVPPGESTLSSPSVPNGQTWTGATVAWSQERVQSHIHEHLALADWPTLVTRSGGGLVSESYRRLNSFTWPMHQLLARMLGGKVSWDHDLYFDYVNRWMSETGAIEAIEVEFGPSSMQRDGETSSTLADAMWVQEHPLWAA